ncbi:hypothetical protein Rsub_07881 [Raphidocelis subcapitata]|uniref:Arginine N-methyltransferase n=1 Tax=Raphidocelis subcapitata TaxID=307507 RepID=A0A2V0P5N5_9CHLO|nr:hypothetical protein Rsub_07881 [Raphidocelis subcapitata]|eukprot:GBF95168.1 hypothetical protein Rsub_07881 [Raphidocelis subcapitata]
MAQVERGASSSAAPPAPTTLASLNQARRPTLAAAAVALARAGDHRGAETALTALLDRAASQKLTRADLHVAHGNRAASRLALGDAAGALTDADACLGLLRAAAAAAGAPAARHASFPKAQLRRGRALAALGEHARAAAAFEAGLAADPASAALAEALAAAQRELGPGGGAALEPARALPAPPPTLRIGFAPRDAPLALLRSDGDGDGDAAGGGGGEPGGGWRDSLAARRGARVEGAALPAALLSAARAASDPALSDVYEYARVVTDTQQPRRWAARALPDGYRWGRWWEAVSGALSQIAAAGVAAPRVLVLGAGGGMLPLMALRAGAAHVACAERWGSLAGACREVLAANGAAEGAQWSVSCVRAYTELRVGEHLPSRVHLVVADLVDDGVLTGGLLPSLAHALENALDPSAPGPLVIPAGIEVFCQPVEAGGAACRAAGAAAAHGGWGAADDDAPGGGGGGEAGDSADLPDSRPAAARVDLSHLEPFRWCPSPALPAPLPRCALRPLAPAAAVWAFDCLAPPDRGGARELDVAFEADGAANALAVWARLRLIGGVELTTGFDHPLALEEASAPAQFVTGTAGGGGGGGGAQKQQSGGAGECRQGAAGGAGSAAAAAVPSPRPPPSQQPALFWLAGRLPVAAGDVLPLMATHNTARLGFDFPGAIYSTLCTPTPSFSPSHFAAAADGARLEAFARALASAASALRAGGRGGAGGLSCLDLGCGGGALAALARGAGFERVVGAELYEPLAAAARHGLAAAAAAAPAAAPPADATAATGSPDAGPLPGGRRAAGGAAAWAVLHADGASLEPGDAGGAVPAGGFDCIVADVWDAGLIGHQGLQLLEAARGKLLAPGGAVIPGRATLWVAGAQLLTGRAGPGGGAAGTVSGWGSGLPGSGGGGGDGGGLEAELGWDFSALDRYRWSPGGPEAVNLAETPHLLLTQPARLFDFDLQPEEPGGGGGGPSGPASGRGGGGGGSAAAAAAARRFPRRAAVALRAERGGVMNAVVAWYDLDLGGGWTVTTAPPGIGVGGRLLPADSTPPRPACCASGGCAGPRAARSGCQGQALTYLPAWVRVAPGTTVELAAERGPAAVTYSLGDVLPPPPPPPPPPSEAAEARAEAAAAPPSEAAAAPSEAAAAPSEAAAAVPDGAAAAPAAAVAAGVFEVVPAPRAQWYREGAGIEDAAVWSLRRCGALLAEAMARAPAMRLPPLWRDFQMLQLHCGSLGLDSAALGAITQELAAREEAAIAAAASARAGGGVALSGAACVEALGLAPPPAWH